MPKQRPLSVTIIGWLFIATGCVGLAYHGAEIRADHHSQNELVWILSLRLLAIVCGVFLLRGNNWARWLLLLWIAYHVVLSAFHTLFEVLVHLLFLAVIAYFLFRKQASQYFQGTNAPTESTKSDDAHAG
jgi:hypothetical protein